MASTAVDAAFVSLFDSEVKAAYQRQGSMLTGTTRKRNVTSAQDLTFQKVGTSVAMTKGRHGLIPTADLSHTNVKVTLADYYDGGYVDSLDLLKTNIDERQQRANAAAWALGRKADDIILTTLDGASNSTTPTLTNSATFRNGLLAAVAALKSRDVPMDNDLWAVCSPALWSWLMCVKEFTSRDWTPMQLPYSDASGNKLQGKQWLGFNFIEHTGVPNVGLSTEHSFLYHRTAIGYAVGQDVSGHIGYIDERDSYLVTSKMSVGAVMIDGNGVQKIILDATAALPTT